MNGRNQPDQGGRFGHGGNEQRQDSGETGKPNRQPKKTAIDQVDQDVVLKIVSRGMGHAARFLENLNPGKTGVERC